MRGLYIHIPFCAHICSYCDFPKMVTFNKNKITEYINKLISELKSYKDYINDDLKTIYIGGGTPNILSDELLDYLLSQIDKYNINPIEYTIECNPELLSDNQAKIFKRHHITRVSLGAESFNNDELKILGRHHNKENIINAINLLRNNDINNISCDIIYGFPGNNMANLLDNINIIKALNIPHVSFYSLILEEHTIFYSKYKNNEFKPLDEDTVADMMELIEKELREYHHYETSNYALPGYESKHNTLYWKCDEYIGIGAGASGYLDGIRYDNSKNVYEYLKGNKKNTLELSIMDKKSEYFMLGFRMLDGVSLNKYKSLFNSDPFIDFNINKLLNLGLLEINGDIIKPTHKGYMLGNIVFEEFVL